MKRLFLCLPAALATAPLTGSGPGGAGYSAPALVNNYALALGDSRTGNAGGVAYASPSFAQTWGFSNGYAGWLGAPGRGRIVLGAPSSNGDWNYGVGAQSTAGIAGRLGHAANDCNDVSHLTNVCFDATKGTNSGAVAAGATSFTFALTSGPAPTVGEFVSFPNSSGNAACVVASVSGAGPYTLGFGPPPGSSLSASNCVTSAISSGQNWALSPAANSSAYAANLGSADLGATITDVDNSLATTGAASPISDPAQVVYLLAGTNDANLSSVSQSTTNLAAMLDALGPAGANKMVILADEVPRGLATGYSVQNATQNGAPETITAAASVTLSQSATYYDTVQVFYAPAGSGPPFAAGANDGVQLTNCTTGTTAAANGTATCTPAAGQYSVSSGGVMSFNAADVGKAVSVYYRYTQNAPGGAYLRSIHDWIANTAAQTRPWVHVASTWAATIDPASPSNCTTTCYPAPYVSVDGLHPEPSGGAVIANAMLSAATAAGAVNNATPFPSPAVNNAYISAVSFANTGSFTPSSDCSGQPNATNRAYWAVTPTPAIATGVYGSAGPLATPALIFANVTTDIPAGTHVICIDATAATKGFLMDQPSAATGSTSAFIQRDGAGLLPGGVFDHVNQLTSGAITGCTAANCPVPVWAGQSFTSGYPTPWTFSIDTNSQAAIAAGTLMFRYGIASNPFSDGTDWFAIQLGGYVSATSGLSIALTQNSNAMVKASIATGDRHRALCDVKIGAGPDGHLYGLVEAMVKAQDTTTATWAAPGQTASSAYTIWAAQAAFSSMEFSDGSIQSAAPGVSGGILALKALTSITKAVDASSGDNMTLSLNLTANKGEPVSATVWFGHCQMLKAAS